MFSSRTIGGIAVAIAMTALAPAANATVTNIYHVGDPLHFQLTSGTPFSPSITANFGDGFTGPLDFHDIFEFTIPQDGVGSGSISTSFSSARNKLTITSLLINGISYLVPPTASGQSLSVSDIPIISGATNTIEVKGFTASRGGTFSGTLTFSADDVPEVATWGMMLAGFGMVGAAMRRQRRVAVSFA